MTDDVDQSVPAGDLRIEISHAGTEVTIIVEGELDLSGSELFSACAGEALGSRPSSMAIDAHGLTFVDSAGLMAMWRARDAAQAAGVPFRVTKATDAVRRVVEILGLEELLSGE